MLKDDRPDNPLGGMGHIPSGPVINYLIHVEREAEAREIDRAVRFVRAIDDEFVKACRLRQEQAKEEDPHAGRAEHAHQ